MKKKLYLISTTSAVAIVAAGLFAFSAFAQPPEKPGTPRIAWYSTLDTGLAEAKRSNRPILLVSAAPQCTGVSGIW